MTRADTIAALAAHLADPATAPDVARAAAALEALRRFPAAAGRQYPLELGRLARRAAGALLELVEGADNRTAGACRPKTGGIEGAKP